MASDGWGRPERSPPRSSGKLKIACQYYVSDDQSDQKVQRMNLGKWGYERNLKNCTLALFFRLKKIKPMQQVLENNESRKEMRHCVCYSLISSTFLAILTQEYKSTYYYIRESLPMSTPQTA